MRRRRTLGIHPRLVAHDITFERQGLELPAEVVATIECERTGCTLRVEVCRRCERFARIEPHEAGYTMLCRSTDEDLEPCAEGELAEQDETE